MRADALPSEGDEAVLKFRVPGNDRLLEIQAVVINVNQDQKHPVHQPSPGGGIAVPEPFRGRFQADRGDDIRLLRVKSGLPSVLVARAERVLTNFPAN